MKSIVSILKNALLNKKYLDYKYLLFFFALVAGWPCVFYLLGWLPHYKLNYICLFIISGILVVFNGKKTISTNISILVFFQGFVWLLYFTYYQDTSYITRIILLLTTYFILIIEKRSKENILLPTYNSWLALQALLGTIGFVLVLLGLLEPISVFREMDGRPGYNFGLFTTNTYIDGLIRIAGFFDEPGALAHWGLIALWGNKLFYKNKTIEWGLLIGLSCTLSLAYYVQLLFYLFVFYRLSLKKLFPILCVVVGSVILISSQSEQFYYAIFGRMEYDAATGTLAGDNRSDLLARCWKVFLENPILGTGASNLIEMSKEIGFVGANFFSLWAADGILGILTMWSPFLYLLVLGARRKMCLFLFVMFMIEFIHRPYDPTQLLYPLTIFMIISQVISKTPHLPDSRSLIKNNI